MASLNRRPEKSLTAQFVKNASTPGKYFDGHGLFLRVDDGGGRYWVQRIVIRGKRREIGLGPASLIPLAEARAAAVENRKTARAGGDPIADKKQAKSILTFKEATQRVHVELSPTWKNPKDRAAFLATLEKYAFGKFGTVLVSEITSADVRKVILDARKVAPEVARKLTFRISAVFKWAIAEGMRKDNPALAGALALPKQEKSKGQRKALPYEEVNGCIAAVAASSATAATKLAIEFVILSACRSGEVRGAVWSEFDLDAKVWTIPAERMKMGREHRVPLSPRVLQILEEAKKLGDGDGFVFPGTKAAKQLSDMTLSKLVKELGYAVDVHGFRASFRTWAQERTNFPREIAEAALAHVAGDAVERAYARSDVFQKRRKMMDAWAAFVADKRSAGIVRIA
ncbi:site-specific integrase [Rhizobium leguminosarum]|uniref:Tyrosine-type recombinase/integrase n=1 Tax=Rhizobium leguminosarum TaxID=384 RepID=A0A7K3VEV0_RHILE|nr:site-specific integrase [Rhizobium leguminosarum]NEK15690.1 tyrosine-type recombinase/integrase [Rhizobium leguminosarum]